MDQTARPFLSSRERTGSENRVSDVESAVASCIRPPGGIMRPVGSNVKGVESNYASPFCSAEVRAPGTADLRFRTEAVRRCLLGVLPAESGPARRTKRGGGDHHRASIRLGVCTPKLAGCSSHGGVGSERRTR